MANFKYVELITTGKEILNAIKDTLTDPAFTQYDFNVTAGETAELNEWKVIGVPVMDTTLTNSIKELVLGTTAKIGSLEKEFHVKFTNLGLTTPNEHSSLEVQVLEGYDESGGTYQNSGHPVNFEWAKEDFAPSTDRDIQKPVYLYMNIQNNRLALVAVGDPAVNFNDYRKSFLYVGAIKPFKYNLDDSFGNIMITAGATKAEPAAPLTGYNFGQYTSYGNNTFQMFATKSGIRFQKHYASFITQSPTPGKAYLDAGGVGDTGLLLEPQGFNASAWTRKYHLSPVYVVHAYDGYRGQLDNCIAVSKNNILHLDELIVDIETGTPGKTWRQEVYRYFDHNTEQNFMNMSANVKMGIAFLKEVRY